MAKKNKKQQPSVLVLGEDTRSFLSVVRSLGKAGYIVHVVCYDQLSPALKSKYIQSAQYYNYQSCSPSEWLDNVIALIERYNIDLVIPCDERAIYPLWSAKNRMSPNVQLAIANQEALDVLFDKWETKQVALACDVPVAKGQIVELSNTSYSTLQQQFGDKFVVKPLQSFEQTKLHQRQKVVIVKSEADYVAYQKHVASNQPYLIEAFFTGKGEGLSVLSVDGQVQAAFAHVRVAEPEEGGGSSYRKSTPLDEQLLNATKAVCEKTSLTGVAMFEYRRNQQTNEWILVEVNARFWGSLPLAIFAGIDFPSLYANYLCHKHKPKVPILSYSNDVYARVLTSDIYEIKREFELKRHKESTITAFKHMILRMLNILRFLGPRETIDSFALSDMRPFVAEVTAIVKALGWSIARKSGLFLRVRRLIARRKLAKLFAVNQNRKILFVCYGNIMRSPLAEQSFRLLVDQSASQLSVDSFGFHLQEQRSSPEKAVEAAKNLNLELSSHRSKWLTQLDINDSDIIIYFDDKNRDKLASYYRVNHAFCAADFVDNSFSISAEIDDPYGGDLDTVLDCYQQIENSMLNLLALSKGTN
ncbi:ATP-grasp domain-containing protein [Vibrio sp. MA40-2]|uniref:arsenate reductase/protein-tyrosine-phosphatase family protein n=1 Tax=Vibrio sp. MA40-2 TaxID=3391828 RepID=UPI0039A40100